MSTSSFATLSVSGAGSTRLAGDPCVRLRNPRCFPREIGRECSSETAPHAAVVPSRSDQVAQRLPPTSLRTVKSP